MAADEVLQNAEHALEAGDTARGVARAYVVRADRAGALPELVGLLRSYDPGAAADLLVDYLLQERRNGRDEDVVWMEGELGGRLVNMADVEQEEVHWLWPAWIPLGKMTILDGDPGVMKSSLALDLAARLSRCAVMPDGSEPDLDGPRGTVLLTAEDGLADTVRPRLDAAGADPVRVTALRGIRTEDGERLPTVDDVAAIHQAVQAVDAALVVVDPLVAYLGPEVDSYRDADVRAALAGLAELANEAGVAVLSIRHLNKSTDGNPLYRGGGSIGFIAAARSGLLVARDPDEPDGDRRILARTKCNLAPEPPALAFRPRAADGTVALEWEGVTGHAARDLLSAASKEERTAREEAADILLEELRNRPRPVAELKDVADRLGVTWRTVRRAADSIGVERSKEGFGADGRWVWSLPAAPYQDRAVPLGGEGGREPGSGRDASYPDRGDVRLGGDEDEPEAEADAQRGQLSRQGGVPLEDGPERQGSSGGSDAYADSVSGNGGEDPRQQELGALLDDAGS